MCVRVCVRVATREVGQLTACVCVFVCVATSEVGQLTACVCVCVRVRQPAKHTSSQSMRACVSQPWVWKPGISSIMVNFSDFTEQLTDSFTSLSFLFFLQLNPPHFARTVPLLNNLFNQSWQNAVHAFLCNKPCG